MPTITPTLDGNTLPEPAAKVLKEILQAAGLPRAREGIQAHQRHALHIRCCSQFHTRGQARGFSRGRQGTQGRVEGNSSPD